MIGEKLTLGTGDLMHRHGASSNGSPKPHQLPDHNPQKTPGQNRKKAMYHLPKNVTHDASDNNLTS
jgi:hypothetical protein